MKIKSKDKGNRANKGTNRTTTSNHAPVRQQHTVTQLFEYDDHVRVEITSDTLAGMFDEVVRIADGARRKFAEISKGV